jgi:hypothetical protein
LEIGTKGEKDNVYSLLTTDSDLLDFVVTILMERTVTHNVFFISHKVMFTLSRPRGCKGGFRKFNAQRDCFYIYSSHDIERPFHGHLLSLDYSLSMQWVLSGAYSLKKSSIIHLFLAIFFQGNN